MSSGRELGHRISVFCLTFFSYAFFHANRKAFSNVKTSTGEVWTPSFHNTSVPALKPDYLWNAHHLFADNDAVVKFQGVLDTSFMVAYATGLFLNGYIGDRVNMRWLLSMGMASTSVLVFIFGCVCEWVSFYNKYLYCSLWILNGLMQSTGWPVVVACMGNWFGKSSRGVLLGIWGSCASVGNIMGALLVSSVLSYGYQYAFLVTSSVLFCASFIVFCGLIPSPEEVGLSGPDDEIVGQAYNGFAEGGREQREPLLGSEEEDIEPADENDEAVFSRQDNRMKNPSASDLSSASQEITYDLQDVKPASLSFWKACLLPGVIPYALAYAFLKLVNYSFFFWLPYYLHNAFGWEEKVADQLSTVYDVSGIVGGILFGYASDRLGKRTVMIMPMLVLSIPALFIYGNSPNDKLINSVMMAVVGLFTGGASSLISSAVSADLGCQKQLSGDSKALASVTGIIDGTGSFGAAAGQIAVPYLQTGLGWHSVFYLFMICMLLTAVCVFPLFVKEMRSLQCRCPGFLRRCWRRNSSHTHVQIIEEE
ncbi:sugar phosphate exchanger 3 [Plakobranchus ocellatus]|uniref:Sugar phosphate exchanger 3 n=1 Tax=Plakobranchus ocellatus TaxID=259542 RepID=A0AAV4A5S4_9GAST|nr:sugar phosphate exchanger 3 [Plakobranchus ocellatus]